MLGKTTMINDHSEHYSEDYHSLYRKEDAYDHNDDHDFLNIMSIIVN